jgi:predicted nucleotidyltransferase
MAVEARVSACGASRCRYGRRWECGMGTRMRAKVVIDRERIAELCRRHHIRKLALFGSVLSDDFRPESDVDVLVDFEPGQVIGFRIFDIEDELSQLFGGHRVDLVREKYLNRRLRDRVLASAETAYAEG